MEYLGGVFAGPRVGLLVYGFLWGINAALFLLNYLGKCKG